MDILTIATTSGILAIIVGILVLIWPRIIRYAVGLYLIAFGFEVGTNEAKEKINKMATIEQDIQARKLCKKYGMKLLVPYTKKLNGDNAAMIGVTAYLKIKGQGLKVKNYIKTFNL